LDDRKQGSIRRLDPEENSPGRLWINVPVALIVAALTPRLILESRSESTTRHFDTPGAVSITAGLSVLVYAIVDANDAGWGSTQTLGLLALAAALIAAFVAIELRSHAPLVPFRIFRLRTLTGANIVGLLVGGLCSRCSSSSRSTCSSSAIARSTPGCPTCRLR
jgi:MFS family permease